MNKEQIQQKFKDYCTDKFHFYPDGDVIGSVNYKDLLDVLEFAFNLGLDVAAENAEADYNILDYNEKPRGSNVECFVLRGSILKHKL